LCNVDYQKGRAHQHINSLKHRRNIKWECTVCFLTFTIIGKKRHLTTKGHLEKLKRIDRVVNKIKPRVEKRVKQKRVADWTNNIKGFHWLFREPKEKPINWFKEFMNTIKNSK
jgi:hypothetical protein